MFVLCSQIGWQVSTRSVFANRCVLNTNVSSIRCFRLHVLILQVISRSVSYRSFDATRRLRERPKRDHANVFVVHKGEKSTEKMARKDRINQG